MKRKSAIWVDDTRGIPLSLVGDFDVFWARTYEEAIGLLQLPNIDMISIDHDLGKDRKTGYDIAKWMVENNICPDVVYVHSMNVVGAENIKHLLKRYFPHVHIIHLPYSEWDLDLEGELN